VPLRGTVCGLLPVLSVIVRAPFLVPLTVGSKNTAIPQLVPGVRALRQLFTTPKSLGLADTEVNVRFAVPVLVTVTLWGRPVVPTYWLGKLTFDGEMEATAAGELPIKVIGCGLPGAQPNQDASGSARRHQVKFVVSIDVRGNQPAGLVCNRNGGVRYRLERAVAISK
jgi:hypothetical protein